MQLPIQTGSPTDGSGPSRRRRLATVVAVLAIGVVAAGCRGETTGVSGPGDNLKLNAVGSCDVRCVAFFRYRAIGGSWRYTPQIWVGRIGKTPFNATVRLKSGNYEYQVCGTEVPPGSTLNQVSCVGPRSTSGTHRFSLVSGIRAATQSTTSLEDDGASSVPPIPVAE